MSFTQLTPPLPVNVTGKGNATAFGVIENGPDSELVWVTAVDATGEICRAASPQVRMRLRDASAREFARPEPRTPAALGRASSRFFKDDGGDLSWRDSRAVHIPDADAEHSAFP